MPKEQCALFDELVTSCHLDREPKTLQQAQIQRRQLLSLLKSLAQHATACQIAVNQLQAERVEFEAGRQGYQFYRFNN